MHCHHVIVGDGLTAAEFATTRTCNSGDCITIIGPNVQNLGRGVAYANAPVDAPWRYAYLLNSPTRSVDTAFANWLSENWDYVMETMSGRSPDWLSAAQPYIDAGQHASLNAPRELYGDFVHATTLEKIETMRSNGVTVQLLASEVQRIEPNDSGLTLITKDNQTIEADSVDVATGGAANQRFTGDNNEHSFTELFGNELAIARKLKADNRLVCIGAGAAMLDLLRFCQSVQSEPQINFTAISPSGKTLEALRPPFAFTPTDYKITGTFERAEDFLSDIFKLQQQALASGASLYETRVGLRAVFMDKGLIEFLPNIVEARKVPRPLFKHFEGGTRDSIDDFNRLMASGHTKLVAGTVQHIESTHDAVCVHYSDAADKHHILPASVVVNCAGPGYANRFDPMTNNMLAQEWISICEHSGGINVGENGQTPINGLRYLGPAVTSIGQAVEPVPLYDALRLKLAVQRFNRFTPGCKSP